MTEPMSYAVQVQYDAMEHYGQGHCRDCRESRLGALVLSSVDGFHRQLYETYRGARPAYYVSLAKQNWPMGLFVLCANDAIRQWLKRRESVGLYQTSKAIGSREQRRRYKITVLAFIGMTCQICGCDDLNVLTIDHPNGDGARHRNLISRGRSSTAFYAALIRNPSEAVGLRTLCQSCQKVLIWERAYGPSPGVVNPLCATLP